MARLTQKALVLVATLACLACPAVEQPLAAPGGDAVPRRPFPAKPAVNTDAMIWRFIGPMVGNRGSAVVGHPIDKMRFYHGASGGLWETTDAGLTWMPLGDDTFDSSSVGAVAIAPSNPDIMYVGMGEPQMRNNVAWGDGVYKTTDGGKTWTHLGLEESRHISQIRIHPDNPDVVYVGAFGHAFGPNEERGVYRTTDGGESWDKVLFKSDKAGVIDLIMNPADPDELYAAMWEFERKAWGPKTAGPDSGLWKTTDGGKTWTEFTYANGLPEGGRGRTGLTMSAADPDRVYALVDSETAPGLYRSNDRGESWKLVSNYFQIIGRPFYYSHIYADQADADHLWSPNNRIWSSTDGGRNWTVEPGIKDDFHDVWIDSNDANRIIASCDGGVQVTLNGGHTWSEQFTQKNAQFYQIGIDDDFPYNVYATGQDILSFRVPSASRWGGISGYETKVVGSGETGSAVPHPTDADIVYTVSSGSGMGVGGSFTRNNLATGQNEYRNLLPEPAFGLDLKDLDDRIQWDLQFIHSVHEPGTFYMGSQRVWRTRDEGMTWEPISGDLTRNERDKQLKAGSGWLPEYFGQEYYSTISRLAESPVKKGVLWTGSDDGMIHVSTNNGKTWVDRSIPNLPANGFVRGLEASPHDAGTAYVAITRYNTADDLAPYVFRTSNYGESWTNINGDLADDKTTFVVREDPKKQGILYLGTHTGVMLSLDDGASWQPLQFRLPAVPVYDLKVKDNDLVIGTNGRGLWVLDDLTPVRESAKASPGKGHLFSVQDHTRFGYSWWLDYAPGGDPGDKKKYFVQNMRAGLQFYEQGVINGEKKRQFVNAGDAKPLGVMMYFRLEEGAKDVSITILDESGEEIITHANEQLTLRYAAAGDEAIDAGLNRFVWNMRYPLPPVIPTRPPTPVMPIARPGTYTARLTVDGVVQESQFELLINPKEMYTRGETDARMAFWMEVYDYVVENSNAIIAALALRDDAAARVEALKASGASATAIAEAEKNAGIIAEAATEYEATFVATGRTLAEIVNLPPKIFSKITFLHQLVETSEGPPTAVMKTQFEKLVELGTEATAEYQAKVKPAMAAFDKVAAR
jgi:photosystem II stability/assembly factor-like uncharacterized protein